MKYLFGSTGKWGIRNRQHPHVLVQHLNISIAVVYQCSSIEAHTDYVFVLDTFINIAYWALIHISILANEAGLW